MRKFLAFLLSTIIIFSSLSITSYAKDYEFLNSEKDYGEISFVNSFAEVGVPLCLNVPDGGEESYIYRWYINGTRIENNENTYTPIECDLNSLITAEVYDAKGNSIGLVNTYLSELPVIYIETENRQEIKSKENYLDAHIKIQGNKEYSSEEYLYDGETQIRGRGNSTWKADKKPYRLKLDSKADLFGMGESKHWVLLSNPFDTSLMRNQISYGLAKDMGLSYQENIWVDVVLNGKPVGNYQLCEHIRVDENRVEITDWESLAEDAAKAIYKAHKDTLTKDDRDNIIDIMSADMSWTTTDSVVYNCTEYTVSDYIEIPDINGGYLLEIVRDVDEYTFSTANGTNVCVDTPEVMSEEMLNSIQGYYQAFEDALFSEDFCTTYEGKTMRYTDFIDVESFAKGFILNELFENFDFGRTSVWMSKDVDGKLVYGPVWDMDNTLSSTFYSWTALNINWLKRLLSDPVFLNELRNVYFEYRYTDIQDLIKDGGDIDSALEKISSSAEYNDYLWKNDVNFKENALDLKLRLQTKINWLDSVLADMPSAYASISTSISNNEYVNSDKLSIAFNRSGNFLQFDFNDTLPSEVKIFADGKYCGSFIPSGTSDVYSLSGIDEDALITAVCYDEKSDVIFGSYCVTKNEIIKVFISSKISKFTYNAGEPLDLDEIELTARYSDGTEQIVEPQLTYTYVKDALGEQFFSYDKVTEEIGETFIVLRHGNAFKEYEIQINPQENHKDVIAMIKKLPMEISGNSFLREIFEAKTAYDALSEEAKLKVTNIGKLNSLLSSLAETGSDSTGVIGCVADGVFLTNARSSILVISKGNPYKVTFTNPDGTTVTYTTSSSAYLYKKNIGDYTISTIKHLIPKNSDHKFVIKPVYSDSHQADAFTITVSEIIEEAKPINSIRYNNWVNEGDKFKLVIDKDSEVVNFALYENGKAIKFTQKDTESVSTLEFSLETPGSHTLALYYSFNNSSIEYGNLEFFVREYKEETNRIFSIDHPSETYEDTIPVNIATSSDVENMSLVCGDIKIDMSHTDGNSVRFWSAEIDVSCQKEYTLYMNSQATQTIISAETLDPFVFEGTKLVKYLSKTKTAEIPSYITEIADDAFEGFEGTILCYPDSAAEAFAKNNGIDYETFEIRLNVKEIALNSGENFEIEISATPQIPSDFNISFNFDESIISFDGKTITALSPGYARLNLSDENGYFNEAVYVYVGGGPRKADINGDGKINSLDALLTLQQSVGNSELNAEQKNAADINNDGRINSLDALIILQIATQSHSIWDYV